MGTHGDSRLSLFVCGHFDVDNDAEKTLDLGYTAYGYPTIAYWTNLAIRKDEYIGKSRMVMKCDEYP